ncbi:MAG: hypothetical protein D6732_21210, partial [Methanobacteriota archaeon]
MMLHFREFLEKKRAINELAHFSEIMSKKGHDFVSELLNHRVTVNLKIDQSAFVVAKVNGQIKYFGREGRVEIDKIRRQGMDLYEPAFEHLEKQNLNKLPNNTYVFLEFFNDRLPTIIRYAKKPKNGLIISYVKRDGKILAPTNPIVNKIAEILNVSAPPVLFDGKLSSSQKAKILDYLNTPVEQLEKKYGGKNFVEFVLSLFVHPKQLRYLITNKLEGVVFYFDDGKKIDMSKIVDPSFTGQIKAKKDGSENLSSEFEVIIRNLIYDNLETAHKKVLGKSKTYQDYIYDLTNEIIKNTKSSEFEKYAEAINYNRFARLNFSRLPSKVKVLVDKVWYAEDIYRNLLFLLSKKKKRANP